MLIVLMPKGDMLVIWHEHLSLISQRKVILMRILKWFSALSVMYMISHLVNPCPYTIGYSIRQLEVSIPWREEQISFNYRFERNVVAKQHGSHNVQPTQTERNVVAQRHDSRNVQPIQSCSICGSVRLLSRGIEQLLIQSATQLQSTNRHKK